MARLTVVEGHPAGTEGFERRRRPGRHRGCGRRRASPQGGGGGDKQPGLGDALAGDADPHLERFSRIERPATSQLDG